MGQGISENKRIGWLVAVIVALLVMILFLCMSVKEITVTGVMVAPYAYPRALQLLPRLNLKCLTETVFDLDDGVAAFDAQLTGKYPKILIKCNPDLE